MSGPVVRGVVRRGVVALALVLVAAVVTSGVRLAGRARSVPAPGSQPTASGLPAPPALEGLAEGKERPRALAEVEGVVMPGLTVTLSARGSSGSDLWRRWIQTDGTAVTLDQPTAAEARFVVPSGATALGFVLVVGNALGVDTATLCIPVERRTATTPTPVPPVPYAPPRLSPTADAGGDQQGTVGRPVTLNGIRSMPRGGVGHRWLQVGGPPVRLKLEDRYIYSFVPEGPGTYQFALVVATGSELSEPDVARVTVSERPGASLAAPVPVTLDPLAESTRAGLASVEGGPMAAEGLAQTFDAIADRMTLYRSYAEAFNELSRRLDVLVPVDPARRAGWVDRLFTPLTARLVEALRPDGLDLGRPEGQAAVLTPAQRDRIAVLFRSIAAGCRALRPAPTTLDP